MGFGCDWIGLGWMGCIECLGDFSCDGQVLFVNMRCSVDDLEVC